MISQSQLFGGATEVSISADITIDLLAYKVWVVSATVAALTIKLPDATTLDTGGISGAIFLRPGSNNIGLVDFAGNTVSLSSGTSLLQNKGVKLYLLDNSTPAGVWCAKVVFVGFANESAPLGNIFFQDPSAVANLYYKYDQDADSIVSRANATHEFFIGASFQLVDKGYYISDDRTAGPATTSFFDEYTSASNTWAAKPVLSFAINESRAAETHFSTDVGTVLDGKIPSTGSRQVWRYVLSSNTWANRANAALADLEDLATSAVDPRLDASTGLSGDHSYLFYGISGGPSQVSNILNSLEFNVDTWTLKTPSNTIRRRNKAAGYVSNGILLVGGAGAGSVGIGYGSQEVQKYLIDTDTYVLKSMFPVPVVSASLTNVVNRLFCMGGSDKEDTATLVRNDTIREYDDVTDTWITKTNKLSTGVQFNMSPLPLTP